MTIGYNPKVTLSIWRWSSKAIASSAYCWIVNGALCSLFSRQLFRSGRAERKVYRVGPNCETWPNNLTENPYQSPKVGPQFGPTQLYNFARAVGCRNWRLRCGARFAGAAALHEDHAVARGVQQPAGARGHVGAKRELACCQRQRGAAKSAGAARTHDG